MINRRTMLGALGAGAAIAANPARAQDDYPSRPVTVVVPFGAGGSTDAYTRLVMQRIGQDLGRSFAVDNRFGASGTIGAASVARSRPDGYTLLLTTISSYAMAPNLMQVPYDNERAFASAGMVASMPMVMLVGRNHPARTIQEYVELARRNPGREIFGNPGTGSSGHLAAELFFQEARIEVNDVAYRGTPAAIQAVIAGEAGMLFVPSSAIMGFVASGELRALGVCSQQRASLLPNAQTFVEAGFPGVLVREDLALLAPAGTPDAILEKLNRAVATASEAPELKERLAALGVEPNIRPRAEWPEYLRFEVARWGELIRARNIRIQ
ncbi:Bug family tripartite tricarboxylate transporter substrate binding protein [Falsiroseomonas sp. HW251]|uniref:Bug family tripartite tricarboxylate transporter substrate binding protein n=1 Tax=Falsiroseomonas sp. HW251 TaxID=3390998 RepID=UPI003D31020A